MPSNLGRKRTALAALAGTGAALAIGAAAVHLTASSESPNPATTHHVTRSAGTGNAATTNAAASSASTGNPTTRHLDPGMLVLGDSVAFGYQPIDATNQHNLVRHVNAGNFRGFGEFFARTRSLHLTNASCPGETSGSFLTGTDSNGCEDQHNRPSADGYRDLFPLHTKYASATQTQIAFAMHYLARHGDTKLVTLTIGANDAFECQADHSGLCTGANLEAMGQKLEKNITTILTRIRGVYGGDIAVMTYYAPDYSDTPYAAQVRTLDGAIRDASKRFHVAYLNGYAAFRRASAAFDGDTCAAGLRIPTARDSNGRPTACDVHPSVKGQRVLAAALSRAVDGQRAAGQPGNSHT